MTQGMPGSGHSGLLWPGPKLTALECLEGMAAGLYSELFTLLISLLNRCVLGGPAGELEDAWQRPLTPLCPFVLPPGR